MSNSIPNREVIEAIVFGLERWRETKKRLVVGIDGQSGTGKTTVVSGLVKLYPDLVTRVGLDFFIRPVEKRFADWKKLDRKIKVFERGWFDLEQFDRVVKEFTGGISKESSINILGRKPMVIYWNTPIILVDGIFLHNKVMFPALFDKIIYLSMDKHTIVRRREVRAKKIYFNLDDQEKLKKNVLLEQLLEVAYTDYIKRCQPDNDSDLVINIKQL